MSIQSVRTEVLKKVSCAVGMFNTEEIPKQTRVSATGIIAVEPKQVASCELSLQSQVIVAMESVLRVY
jgi:hypothetical protein